MVVHFTAELVYSAAELSQTEPFLTALSRGIAKSRVGGMGPP
jgi:hypothetical protein